MPHRSTSRASFRFMHYSPLSLSLWVADGRVPIRCPWVAVLRKTLMPCGVALLLIGSLSASSSGADVPNEAYPCGVSVADTGATGCHRIPGAECVIPSIDGEFEVVDDMCGTYRTPAGQPVPC